MEIKEHEDKKQTVEAKPNVGIVSTDFVPAGYIPIELSTNGKLGVPKIINIKNFSTSDLLDLSMYSESLLPKKIIAILNSLIYEKVNVADWPDRVIVEVLIKLYANFFTPMLTSITFPWNSEDVDYLTANGEEAKAAALQEGSWVPKIDFDLTKLSIIALDENSKSTVTIGKHYPDGQFFKIKFATYPKFGDSIRIDEEVDKVYLDKDKEFADIKQRFNLRERFINEGINLDHLPVIEEHEYIKWQEYEITKAIYMTKVAQAIYLLEIDGKDVSEYPLPQKIALLDKSQYDVKMAKKITEEYNKLNFGIDPNVEVKNPITGKLCTRRFYFRLMDILQAIQSGSTDEYDISYDD